MSSFGIQEIITLLVGIVVLLIPVAFIGLLITAIIRRTAMWWVLAGVTGLITVLSIIPVLFIGARAWKKGSDRAEALMRERAMEQAEVAGEAPGVQVTCKEGIVRLTVPARWGDLTEEIGNEDASLSYGNMAAEQYAIVITEPRADIVEVFGEENPFGAMHEVLVSQFTSSLGDVRSFPVETLSHPGAINAVRTRIQGTTEGHNVTYLLYVFETRDHFHQLMFWTIASDIDSVLPVFEDVAVTFGTVD